MNITQRNHAWTEEMDKLASDMWRKGSSANEIACELFAKFADKRSRNAVIGRIHRLGLGRQVAGTKPSRGGIPRKMKLTPQFNKPKKSDAIFKSEPLPKEDLPPAHLIALHDLEDHHCRWGYGDPKEDGFGFCGGAKVIGLPYCPTHVRRAFTQPQTKPKDYVPQERRRVFA